MCGYKSKTNGNTDIIAGNSDIIDREEAFV